MGPTEQWQYKAVPPPPLYYMLQTSCPTSPKKVHYWAEMWVWRRLLELANVVKVLGQNSRMFYDMMSRPSRDVPVFAQKTFPHIQPVFVDTEQNGAINSRCLHNNSDPSSVALYRKPGFVWSTDQLSDQLMSIPSANFLIIWKIWMDNVPSLSSFLSFLFDRSGHKHSVQLLHTAVVLSC